MPITSLQRSAIALLSAAIYTLYPVQAQTQGDNAYSNPAIEQSEAYIQGNPYQKDVLLFIDLIQSTHPAFATNADAPFDANKVRKESYRQAAEFQSTAELRSCLQEITTRLEDGHTTLMPPFDNSSIYPFALFIGERNIFLQAVSRDHKPFLGKQITQINGRPVWKVIGSFRKMISCDNEIFFRDKVGGFMQFHSMWANNPYAQADSTLLLTFTDGQSITLRPTPKGKLNIVWAQPSTASDALVKLEKAPFSYTILAEQKLCYLFFNTCADQSTARAQLHMQYKGNIPSQMEQRLAQIPQFDLFLAEMFREITDQQITTLVVDVRHNGGGNSHLCDLLLSWLRPADEIKSFSGTIRFSPLWEQHYPALADKYRKAFIEHGIPFEMDKLYDGTQLPSLTDDQNQPAHEKQDSCFQKNQDKKNVFRGRVIFVQSTKTYSSAGILVTQAADNGIGTIIGEESSYRPCHYGDLLTWELPNTKLKGYVSHKIFRRPNHTKCGEPSLMPDVLLSPTWDDIQSGRDVFQKWIFKNNGPHKK